MKPHRRYFEAEGRVVVDKHGARIQFHYDLAKYLNWHLEKKAHLGLQLPYRAAKIGLYNPKVHKIKPDQTMLNFWKGKKVMVKFYPEDIMYLKSKKGFWVHFIQFKDDKINEIVNSLGLKKEFKYHIPHMSISNGKHLPH